MQINDIKALVARLEAIVEGWDEKSGAPAVERHIAASLLAELYEAVKFDTALAATPIAKVDESAPIMTEEVAEPEEETAPEVIDLSDIFGSSSYEPEEVAEPTEEPIEEQVEEEPIEEEPIEEPVPAIEEEILVVEEELAVEEEPAPEEPIAEVEVEQTEEVEPTDEQPIEEVAEVEQPAEEIAEQPTEDTVENIVAEEQPTAAEEEQSTEEVEEQPAAEEEQPATTDEEKPAEEEKPKSEQASLFDMDIVRRPRSSSGRRVIMSLYGESPATSRREKKAKSAEPIPSPEQKPEQKTEQEPIPAQPESVVEQTPAPAPEVTETPIAVSVAERIAAAQADGSQVLGDVIGAGTTTLAEAVAASQPTVQTVQNDRVNSLRNSIGINDRFIMIRDLFGGDGAAFDRAMDELDAFEDFNECLVYMSEYRWNPNSDGARMLMDLVTRKLL